MSRNKPSNRGGQRVRYVTQLNSPPAPPQQPPPPPDEEEENTMAVEVEDTSTQQQEDEAPGTIQIDHDDVDWNKQFGYLSDQEYDDVYQDNRDSYYKNGNIVNAKKMYESASAKPTTDTVGNTPGQSYSQDMNYRLNHDIPLDSDSKFMKKYLEKGMHPIGKDCMLVRGAHDTVVNQVLQASGIQSYQGLSQSQLSAALVGQTIKMKSFGSFGANNAKNPFIGGSQSGGREVIIYARTNSTTKVIAGAKSQAEFITAPGQQMRITKVNLTNKTAFTRKSGTKNVIELFVDMW